MDGSPVHHRAPSENTHIYIEGQFEVANGPTGKSLGGTGELRGHPGSTILGQESHILGMHAAKKGNTSGQIIVTTALFWRSEETGEPEGNPHRRGEHATLHVEINMSSGSKQVPGFAR